MNPVLYLIDGHAQIFRAYYAMESLKSPHGVPTGAAFGFTRMLQDLISVYKPDGLAVCLDAPGKNFRHERYADYKATRKTTPPELVQQVPYVIDIVNAFRIPIFSLEGYEADDLLGSLARQAKEAGWDTVLVTGDKDAGQLLCENVRILDPMKNIVIDHAGFTEKKGLPPDKLVDLMGLWGDSSDNIPGVPGIGEKIGVQLIQEFGSLENLLENADLVKGKRGEVLRANKEQALMSKELATIDCHAPVTLDLELIKPQQPDVPKLRDIFTRLDFRSLLKRLEEQADPGSPPIAAAVVEQVDYRLINNEADLAAFMAEAMKQPRVAVDTETTGLDPLLDKLVGMSFSWQENSAYYLAFRAPLGETALPLSALETVRPLIESETIAKTGHNLKFDALVLRRAGLELKNGDFDTCIASSLSDGHLAEHGLKTICRRYYNVEMTPIEKLIGSGRNQTTMDLVPTAEVAQYAAADADISFRLYNTLSERLDERGARSLFENVEMPLSRLLTDMQWTGIGIDCDLLARESAETGRMLDALTAEIYQLAGHQFNIGSPKQLAVVLFEEHGLPVVRKTQTGASTDESVLQELAHVHGSELAERILEYRMYAKLKNTYLDALPKLVNLDTGRVHTSFSQVRTATGRLASSNPNLQNIPIRTERGRAVRAAFVPLEGWKMLAADYSQVELRILAAFSGDEILARAFAEDMDIHRVVAAEVNGIKPEDVTKEQRSSAKAVNFGIIYGQSAHGLSATTGMSRARAQRFIDDYFQRFPRVGGWMEESLEKAREQGYVETLLGFRRQLPDIKATNRMRRARAEREAINTIIQGSAADVIKTAMVKLAERLRRDRLQSRLLLQIHDELLLEGPPEEIDSLRLAVTDSMENAIELPVRLKVDIGVGDNWLETK